MRFCFWCSGTMVLGWDGWARCPGDWVCGGMTGDAAGGTDGGAGEGRPVGCGGISFWGALDGVTVLTRGPATRTHIIEWVRVCVCVCVCVCVGAEDLTHIITACFTRSSAIAHCTDALSPSGHGFGGPLWFWPWTPARTPEGPGGGMLGPTIPAEQPAQTNPLLKSPQASAAPLNIQHSPLRQNRASFRNTLNLNYTQILNYDFKDLEIKSI